MPKTRASSVAEPRMFSGSEAGSMSSTISPARSPRCTAAGWQKIPTRSLDVLHEMGGDALREAGSRRPCRQPALGDERSFTKSQTASWLR
jgi:hypothetical protein